MTDMQPLLHARLKLTRGFSVFTLSPTQAQIRSGLLGGQALNLPDPTGSGQLAALLQALDGQRTTAEVLGPFPAQLQPVLLRLIAALVDRQLVQRMEEGERGSVLDGLSGCKLPPSAVEQVAAAKLAVIGAGVLGSRVALALHMSGFRQLVVWDDKAVGPDDRLLSPVYGDVSIGENRANGLANYLNRLGDEPAVQALSAITEAVTGRTMVVVAADFFAPRWFAEMNRLMLEREAPWLFMLLDGTMGLIGPVFYPGQTACYECLQAYWQGQSRNQDQFVEMLEGLQSAPPKVGFAGLPAFADAVAGLGVAHLPRVLAGLDSPMVGQALAIDFPNLSAFTYNVPRLPNCSACSLKQLTKLSAVP